MNTLRKISDCYYLFRANRLATYSCKTFRNMDHHIFKYGLSNKIDKILTGKKKYDLCIPEIIEVDKSKIKPYVELEEKIHICTACWPSELFFKYFQVIDMKKITSKHLTLTTEFCGIHDLPNGCWNRLIKIVHSYQLINGSIDSDTKNAIFHGMLTNGYPAIDHVEKMRRELQLTDYDGTDALEQNLYRRAYNSYITYLLDNSKIDLWNLEIKHQANPTACRAIIHQMMTQYDREIVKGLIIKKNLMYHAYYGKFYQKFSPFTPKLSETNQSYQSYISLLESFNLCNNNEIKRKAFNDMYQNNSDWVLKGILKKGMIDNL